MPLLIIRDDITAVRADAIVNAASHTLLGGGGVSGAIHKAAGKRLLAACAKRGGCEPGTATVTKGYNLPCKYVIHTVGPRWEGGTKGEEAVLAACYSESLKLAKEHKCDSVAFPLIASGAHGYPKDEALKAATRTISAFLEDNEMLVYLVVYDRDAFMLSKQLSDGVVAYIDEHYVEAHPVEGTRPILLPEDFQCQMSLPVREDSTRDDTVQRRESTSRFDTASLPSMAAPSAKPYTAKRPKIDELVAALDESFSEMLLRKLREKDMIPADCYKRANIDRKLFSKIQSDKYYKPSKPTAAAFAIALELPPAEARELLYKAGFSLSHSSKFDVIVEYFIVSGNYNVHEINEVIFAYDKNLIGG